MKKEHKLVIGGDSAFAEIAYEYFSADSAFEPVAFSVEAAFLKRDSLFGLPVVPFEELEKFYDPAAHYVHAAIVYTQMNRLRRRIVTAARSKGYSLASYVSSSAFVWKNVQIGEHCFIFEDNTVQPFVKIGDNVVLWSGNHIGHHSTIRDNVFISSHVVVSGFCDIGDNTFLGVNSTLANNVSIGADCWVGPGATIMQDAPPDTLFKSPKAEVATVGARRFFRIRES
jgi:sugar O-acyltransferase (sialic acid O-acetyltransferase NeuD family)